MESIPEWNDLERILLLLEHLLLVLVECLFFLKIVNFLNRITDRPWINLQFIKRTSSMQVDEHYRMTQSTCNSKRC